MPTVNQQLKDSAVRHAVFLERLKASQENEILAFFDNEVFPDFISKLERGLSETLTKRELRALTRTYTDFINSGFVKGEGIFSGNLNAIAKQEAVFQFNILADTNSLLPIDLVFRQPSIEVLRQIVSGTTVRGKLVSQWFADLGSDLATRTVQQINIGLVEGESIEQIVRRIKGTRTSPQLISKSRRDIRTIVRTSVNHVNTQAREQTMKENTDVLKGVEYIATLDSLTTIICANLDGKIFPIGKGPRPPQHFNCRSTTAPVVKSIQELGLRFKPGREPKNFVAKSRNIKGKKRIVNGEEVKIIRTRLDGKPSMRETFPQWLKRQPTAIQNDTLGVGKARLFRKGVPIKKFTDGNNLPLTLQQIVVREKALIESLK